jgi:hypothetical protein
MEEAAAAFERAGDLQPEVKRKPRLRLSGSLVVDSSTAGEGVEACSG